MNILITGGASGLGEAITRKLAKDSDSTIYFTYNKSKLNAEKLRDEFPRAIPIKCDFRNIEEVNALKDNIASLNLDVLINNAYLGNPIKYHFHKINSVEFLTEFNDNIIPTIAITQSAINNFRKKRHGKIITILTSYLLNKPPIGSSVYVANKAYLKELSKSWANENAAFSISSNTVSPAFMLTNLSSDVDDRVIEQMKENHPLKKLLTAEEVAEAVFFLVNVSVQVNGVDIVINAAANIR
jgi:3-oxoacyl-[acyl-carrier protein] reductase